MLTPQLLFPEAANLWLREKSADISDGMVKDYTSAIRALSRFFGLTALADIDVAHCRVYVRSRKVRAGASRINKAVLQSVALLV